MATVRKNRQFYAAQASATKSNICDLGGQPTSHDSTTPKNPSTQPRRRAVARYLITCLRASVIPSTLPLHCHYIANFIIRSLFDYV